MLRRKLLLNLGPVVGLMLLTVIIAIWMLQGVLRDLNHINTEAWRVVEDVNELSIKVNAVEAELYRLQLGRERHLDLLIDAVESTRELVARLGSHYMIHEEPCRTPFEAIGKRLPEFERHVGALATVQDPELARVHNEAALSAAVDLRHNTLPLSRLVRDHAHGEQEAVSNWFRWLVLGLAIVFLLVINVSVMILLRMGAMILRPVDMLVAATRELGQEHFDFRVKLDQHDEFDELAQAYNALAGQLQSNERQRIETLAQAAVAMNHELNNAIGIIDLQLALLARQAGGNPALEKYLRQIHECLERVTQTVQSLKNVRRIVLTDYVPGTKMLDLQRSIEDDERPPRGEPAGAAAANQP